MSEVSTQAGDPANAPIRAGEIDKASDYDSEGYDRRLSPPAMSLIMVASVLYALFHLAVLNFWAIDEWMFRVVHVNMGALIACVALRGVKGERMDRVPLRDGILTEVGRSLADMYLPTVPTHFIKGSKLEFDPA